MTEHDDIRRNLFRLTVLPGWVVLGLTSLVFLLGASVPLRYQFLPLIVSVVVFGLPHGAVDHLTPSRARGKQATLRAMGVVGLLYAVLMTLYGGVWFLYPVAAFVCFILLTWAHWGQGEVHALVTIVDISHLETRVQRAMVAVSRGALPMLVPLVAFPNQFRFVAETLVGLFTSSNSDALSAAFTVRGRTIVAIGLGVVLLTSLLLGYCRRTNARDWILDVGEVGLLVAFFSTVPPILAVGLYFSFWHALRHIGRLLAIDSSGRDALAHGNLMGALARFSRDATPLTLAAIGIVAASYFLVPAAPVGLADVVGLYLVVIAVLTLPHVAVVTWLDIEQRVWSGEPIQLT